MERKRELQKFTPLQFERAALGKRKVRTEEKKKMDQRSVRLHQTQPSISSFQSQQRQNLTTNEEVKEQMESIQESVDMLDSIISGEPSDRTQIINELSSMMPARKKHQSLIPGYGAFYNPASGAYQQPLIDPNFKSILDPTLVQQQLDRPYDPSNELRFEFDADTQQVAEQQVDIQYHEEGDDSFIADMDVVQDGEQWREYIADTLRQEQLMQRLQEGLPYDEAIQLGQNVQSEYQQMVDRDNQFSGYSRQYLRDEQPSYEIFPQYADFLASNVVPLENQEPMLKLWQQQQPEDIEGTGTPNDFVRLGQLLDQSPIIRQYDTRDRVLNYPQIQAAFQTVVPDDLVSTDYPNLGRNKKPDAMEGWKLVYGPLSDFLIRVNKNVAALGKVKYGSNIQSERLQSIDNAMDVINSNFIFSDPKSRILSDKRLNKLAVQTYAINSLLEEQADGRQLSLRDVQAGVQTQVAKEFIKLVLGGKRSLIDEDGNVANLHYLNKVLDPSQRQGLSRDYTDSNLLATTVGRQMLLDTAEELLGNQVDLMMSTNTKAIDPLRKQVLDLNKFNKINRKAINAESDLVYGISPMVNKLQDIVFILKGIANQPQNLIGMGPKQIDKRFTNQIIEGGFQEYKDQTLPKVLYEKYIQNFNNYVVKAYKDEAIDKDDEQVKRIKNDMQQMIEYNIGEGDLYKTMYKQVKKYLQRNKGIPPQSIEQMMYSNRTLLSNAMMEEEKKQPEDELLNIQSNPADACCICSLQTQDDNRKMTYMQCCGRIMHRRCANKYITEMKKAAGGQSDLIALQCPYCGVLPFGLTQNRGNSEYATALREGRQYNTRDYQRRWIQDIIEYNGRATGNYSIRDAYSISMKDDMTGARPDRKYEPMKQIYQVENAQFSAAKKSVYQKQRLQLMGDFIVDMKPEGINYTSEDGTLVKPDELVRQILDKGYTFTGDGGPYLSDDSVEYIAPANQVTKQFTRQIVKAKRLRQISDNVAQNLLVDPNNLHLAIDNSIISIRDEIAQQQDLLNRLNRSGKQRQDETIMEEFKVEQPVQSPFGGISTAIIQKNLQRQLDGGMSEFGVDELMQLNQQMMAEGNQLTQQTLQLQQQYETERERFSPNMTIDTPRLKKGPSSYIADYTSPLDENQALAQLQDHIVARNQLTNRQKDLQTDMNALLQTLNEFTSRDQQTQQAIRQIYGNSRDPLGSLSEIVTRLSVQERNIEQQRSNINELVNAAVQSEQPLQREQLQRIQSIYGTMKSQGRTSIYLDENSPQFQQQLAENKLELARQLEDTDARLNDLMKVQQDLRQVIDRGYQIQTQTQSIRQQIQQRRQKIGYLSNKLGIEVSSSNESSQQQVQQFEQQFNELQMHRSMFDQFYGQYSNLQPEQNALQQQIAQQSNRVVNLLQQNDLPLEPFVEENKQGEQQMQDIQQLNRQIQFLQEGQQLDNNVDFEVNQQRASQDQINQLSNELRQQQQQMQRELLLGNSSGVQSAAQQQQQTVFNAARQGIIDVNMRDLTQQRVQFQQTEEEAKVIEKLVNDYANDKRKTIAQNFATASILRNGKMNGMFQGTDIDRAIELLENADPNAQNYSSQQQQLYKLTEDRVRNQLQSLQQNMTYAVNFNNNMQQLNQRSENNIEQYKQTMLQIQQQLNELGNEVPELMRGIELNSQVMDDPNAFTQFREVQGRAIREKVKEQQNQQLRTLTNAAEMNRELQAAVQDVRQSIQRQRQLNLQMNDLYQELEAHGSKIMQLDKFQATPAITSLNLPPDELAMRYRRYVQFMRQQEESNTNQLEVLEKELLNTTNTIYRSKMKKGQMISNIQQALAKTSYGRKPDLEQIQQLSTLDEFRAENNKVEAEMNSLLVEHNQIDFELRDLQSKINLSEQERKRVQGVQRQMEQLQE